MIFFNFQISDQRVLLTTPWEALSHQPPAFFTHFVMQELLYVLKPFLHFLDFLHFWHDCVLHFFQLTFWVFSCHLSYRCSCIGNWISLVCTCLCIFCNWLLYNSSSLEYLDQRRNGIQPSEHQSHLQLPPLNPAHILDLTLLTH